MLKINGKEMVYSVSFMMDDSDDVVLTPQQLEGGSLRFVAVKKEGALGSGQQEITNKVEGRELKITFPMLEQASSLSFGMPTMAETVVGKFSARVCASVAGNFMKVQVDMFLERAPNYSQK